MTIGLIVTRGFGNGTLTTTIKNMVTIGYTIGAELSIWTDKNPVTTNWADKAQVTTTWSDQAAVTTVWTDKT